MKKDKQYRHVSLSLLTFIYSSLHFPKHHLYTSIMFFMVRVNTIKINIILYIYVINVFHQVYCVGKHQKKSSRLNLRTIFLQINDINLSCPIYLVNRDTECEKCAYTQTHRINNMVNTNWGHHDLLSNWYIHEYMTSGIINGTSFLKHKLVYFFK